MIKAFSKLAIVVCVFTAEDNCASAFRPYSGIEK